MDFKTFKKCIDFIHKWRQDNELDDTKWPESRDPEVQAPMTDFGVIPQDVEKSVVALCAWREMRGDCYQGMSAVVHVIRNRQAKGWFRSHLDDDVETKYQFSSMTVAGDPNLTQYPQEDEKDFNILLQNIDDILTGRVVDITQGALYYCVIADSTSKWFMDHIVNDHVNHPRTISIGRTTFFK